MEGKQKRASEPLISYTSVLDHGSSQSENKIQQNISATGSGIPILNVPPIRPVSPYSLSTTNPLGLTLVYAFPHPILDVVFLHGLGGTSRGTWSWEHDPANFWPLWLPDDVEFSRTRIFTFGYNAAMTGQYTSLNILDFAKDLLFRMKTYLGDNEQGNTQIGKVCFFLRFPFVMLIRSFFSVQSFSWRIQWEA